MSEIGKIVLVDGVALEVNIPAVHHHNLGVVSKREVNSYFGGVVINSSSTLPSLKFNGLPWSRRNFPTRLALMTLNTHSKLTVQGTTSHSCSPG